MAGQLVAFGRPAPWGIALTTCSRSSAKDLESCISPFRCELACQSGVKLEYWIEEPCDVSANQYKRLLLVLIVRYIYEVEKKTQEGS